MQNVPITIQALTADTLKQLSATTFDDYVKYLPNVTAPTNGPGQGNIFMRGLSVGQAGSQSSGTIGQWPNVAVYLDDQSGQLPARNLDVYAADLERIEILEGPQGTLFGAGAQAGVVRYITNKPKLNVTEGSVEAGYGVTAHGDPNSDLTAVLNLPLIQDTLAVRAVIYNDRRGGYIDNVPATFTRKDTRSRHLLCEQSGRRRAGQRAGHQQQQYRRTGHQPGHLPGHARVSPVPDQRRLEHFARPDLPRTWTPQGVFYQMPYSSDGAPLQPREVTLFNNAYDKDKFENTAWTVNGKIGFLKAVYTGAYLVRHVNQVGDYTNYARGVYADYYQCYGPSKSNPNLTSTCYSPSATWQETGAQRAHEP